MKCCRKIRKALEEGIRLWNAEPVPMATAVFESFHSEFYLSVMPRDSFEQDWQVTGLCARDICVLENL